LDNLWAPWRSDYIEKPSAGSACVFCELYQPGGDDREKLVLWRGPNTFVLMNRFPYNNGHLLVLPGAHHGRYDELAPDVFAAVHETLARAVRAVETALRPDGMNVGMNLGRVAGAGIPGHLHYHIVPRWNGDTNFMPVIGETKVISQHLLATYDRLKPAF
jgi:ATP adenylyltransferase